jgi:hypothetical protein
VADPDAALEAGIAPPAATEAEEETAVEVAKTVASKVKDM